MQTCRIDRMIAGPDVHIVGSGKLATPSGSALSLSVRGSQDPSTRTLRSNTVRSGQNYPRSVRISFRTTSRFKDRPLSNAGE